MSVECTASTDIRACHMSTVGLNVRAFFFGQFAYLHEHGFNFTVVTSEPTRDGLALPDQTTYRSIPLTRTITPYQDLKSIWKLYRLFRANRFDLVQYTTPKGALLGSIAAWLARVPIRLYFLWGVYYVGRHGIKRRFFKFLERLTCWLSTHVIFDGFGIRAFAIREGLCAGAHTSVIGRGSDNGIDTSRFDRAKYAEAGRAIRRQWGIPEDAKVIGTVTRLVGDKGINELVAAFVRLAESHRDAYLLLVGPEEEKDQPMPATLRAMREHPRIVLPGMQEDTLPYYAAMSIFSLATYREGFSAVNLEAAAMGLPVVTTDAIGAGESILDGETGIVVPVRNTDELAEALGRLLDDTELSRTMGEAGRNWVEENFEQSKFWEGVLRHRQQLLVDNGLFRREGHRLVRV